MILQISMMPRGEERKISPTDVAQFIRLEQCERYLRLRLFERNVNARFMYDYDVVPQSIPPLLTISGAVFEDLVETQTSEHFRTVNYKTQSTPRTASRVQNDDVIQIAGDLTPGEVVVVLQPRLDVQLGEWRLRGDIDILRLERDRSGNLHALIVDMKSTTTAKVEHRLQVAFYLEMLATLFAQAGISHGPIEMGILYRGPAGDGDALSDEERQEREDQYEACERYFGSRVGLLEIVADSASYLSSVSDLVTGPGSTASRIAETEFNEVPFHLTYKCDGCLFNEFCMKWSAEHDSLSLLPHLTPEDKNALQRSGVETMRELATLKDFRVNGDEPAYRSDLVAAQGNDAQVRRLSATWPVGPRLDELVHRARRYRRWKGDDIKALPYIPSKGYGSLPYSDAKQNPNLVRIYIDAQHDYLHDRIYMLGALVVGCENGQESPKRRRSIVHMTDGRPDSTVREEQLFLRWVEETMRALVEVAAPDEDGEPNAPIHLIFFNHFEQRLLLDGLARHFSAIMAATPLYDFVTHFAAYDSPIATYLDQEIRELKNYPMVCQSLQAVAGYLKFDWNEGEAYRELFRTRLFDFWGKFEWENPTESPWYTSRSRFNSQIPLEYAYAAWGELEESVAGKHDEFAWYRGATAQLLQSFHERRLEALEWIAHDFSGNKQTEKRPFHLPDLANFDGKAQTMAQALDEFVSIERHVELNDWKSARLAPPERRVLAGQTLIVRYEESNQTPDDVERHRANAERYRRAEAWKAANPGMKMSKQERDETKWSQEDMHIHLRLDGHGLDCELDEVLALSEIGVGDRVVISPRVTVDSRLPESEQRPFTPTAKQMLWSPRATVMGFEVSRDASEHATSALIELRMEGSRGGTFTRGFAFGSIDRPFGDGELYTLDPDPNDWYGYFCAKVTEELCANERALGHGNNTVYDRITDFENAKVTWPPEAYVAQDRFLQGLDALQQAGLLDPFEDSKCEYIGRHGDAPILLVQGPPGTGKSYSTAFALFARLQGAMAADLDFRIFLSCKTHAATDVLLRNVVETRNLLRKVRGEHPVLFAQHMDARLLEVPLFRLHRVSELEGIISLRTKAEREAGDPIAAEAIADQRWCVVAATPGGTYRMHKDRWDSLFGHRFCQCLVLDEASQMNLPEAAMAALSLTEDGQLIVVGDHRQMPPIVKHDWANEPRRTFGEFRSYESLFLALLPLNPPMIKFRESFRLHADMAEFLRREVYQQDGIDFFSRKRETLPPCNHSDPYVASVLHPDHTLVVVVHEEAESLLRNPYEQTLITPILEALAEDPYNLDPLHGLGVVVPHTAQRAALREAVPQLRIIDPATGAVTRTAVDTVERFQGDERTAILVGATESDRSYLLVSADFLLDPRRLTVALSRAKRKMILVASQSIFSLFSPDEETFVRTQLWKNLLRYTCTVKLWDGGIGGKHVTVWGNQPGRELNHSGVLPDQESG